MLGLVGHVASEVTSDDAVPCWVVLFVELLLDVGGDVLFNVVLLQSLGGAVHGILLHVLRHISILDYSLAVRHDDCCKSDREDLNFMNGRRTVVNINWQSSPTNGVQPLQNYQKGFGCMLSLKTSFISKVKIVHSKRGFFPLVVIK